jgi:hypothetical protein
MYTNEDATLEDVVFDGNQAGTPELGGEGAGLYVSGAAHLQRVSFTGNVGYRQGGGLYGELNGGGTFEDVVFENNASLWSSTATATSGHQGYGGGAYIMASYPANDPIRVTRGRFSRNSAAGGGGITVLAAVEFRDCLFESNWNQSPFPSGGGGIWARGGAPATLSNVRFVGNQADVGAGMVSFAPSVTMDRVSFFDNLASLRASSFEGPAITATNLVVADTAGSGQTFHIRRQVAGEGSIPDSSLTNVTFATGSVLTNESFATIRVMNSILLGVIEGSPVQISYSCTNSALRPGDDQGHNLSHCGATPHQSPFSFQSATDYSLVAGAAALDAGLDSAPGLSGISGDFSGRPRFAGTVDLGAYERQ